MAYVCFIVDAFSRRIVGWRVASNMRTDDGPRRAWRWPAAPAAVADSSGSSRTPMPGRSSRRCASPNASTRSAPDPSIGTVADSYDNALAETTNGLYKTECVYGPDAAGWDDVDELELATLSWVHWFNEDRLHGHCGDVPPAEFETAFYAAQQTDPAGVGNQ